MNQESINPYEGVDMKTWSLESAVIAKKEIIGIAMNQGPTGRTDGESNIFKGLIVQMNNREITPEDAILKARKYADGRQDGHGGGVVQD